MRGIDLDINQIQKRGKLHMQWVVVVSGVAEELKWPK
jgi:hypothetical protein